MARGKERRGGEGERGIWGEMERERERVVGVREREREREGGKGEERKRKTGVGDSRGGEGKKGGSGLWWLRRVYADT